MTLLYAILRRTAVAIVTLFAVSALLFIGTGILPGDIPSIILGQLATPESVAALRAKLGLDEPVHVQYWIWLSDLLSGNLGFTKAGAGTGAIGVPISELLMPRLANTLRLAVAVAAIAVPFGVTVGLLAAMYSGTKLDRAVTFTALGFVSVPDFLVATLLVLIVAVELRWLPATAYISGEETGMKLVLGLAMPALTMAIAVSSRLIPMVRGTVLNALSSPYIEMAILKGVPRQRVVFRHGLVNALGPIMASVVLSLLYLVSGVVVIEILFSYPGLGKLMLDAVLTRDPPLIQACAMIFCTIYIVLVFIADIVSILFDPRLRHPK